MEVKEEGAFMVYNRNELVAILKRDNQSGKHLVYKATEANSSDIAEMLVNKEYEQAKKG